MSATKEPQSIPKSSGKMVGWGNTRPIIFIIFVKKLKKSYRERKNKYCKIIIEGSMKPLTFYLRQKLASGLRSHLSRPSLLFYNM